MRVSSHIDADFGSQSDIANLIAILDSPQARQHALKLDKEIDVCRITWASREVIAKCYKHVGLIHSVRHTLKKSRARRGWLNAHRLIERGVRTPRPLGYMDEYRGPLLWRSFLLTEFECGRRLDDVLKDDRISEGTKRRIIRQVLRLIDRLAKSGISHGDMKHTNILCDGPQITLTDLDGMQVHSLGWLRRARQHRDIRRFLRGLAISGGSPLAEVADSFVRIASGKGCLYINDRFRDAGFEEAMLREPTNLCDRFAADRIASSDGSRVWRFEAPLGSVRSRIYLKEYLERSWLDRIKHLLRANRARRAMKGSLLLGRCGLKAPQIVAVGWLRAGLLKRRCFMAATEAPDAQPVLEYFWEGCEPYASCTLRDRRQLLRQLGREIGRMHRAGIVHGDLRPGNILVRRGDRNWEFFFIDNERTKRWPRIPRKLRLKNLVQLNMLPSEIGNTDRLRFFHAYLLVNPTVRLDYRQWAARVMAVTNARLRKKGWMENRI